MSPGQRCTSAGGRQISGDGTGWRRQRPSDPAAVDAARRSRLVGLVGSVDIDVLLVRLLVGEQAVGLLVGGVGSGGARGLGRPTLLVLHPFVLGAPVLEPDFDLERTGAEASLAAGAARLPACHHRKRRDRAAIM